MPGTSYGTSLPYGFEGQLSYSPDNITVTKPVKIGTPNIPYGLAVIQNADNTVMLADSTITAANFAGIATSEVKQNLAYPASASNGVTVGNTSGSYAPLTPADITERGIVSVKCRNGTPTAGGAVFVRKVLNGAIPAGILGGLEAVADSTNTVQLTNCSWYSGKVDSNGMTQLRIKSLNV